jgi:hypothetical protein
MQKSVSSANQVSTSEFIVLKCVSGNA